MYNPIDSVPKYLKKKFLGACLLLIGATVQTILWFIKG